MLPLNCQELQATKKQYNIFKMHEQNNKKCTKEGWVPKENIQKFYLHKIYFHAVSVFLDSHKEISYK